MFDDEPVLGASDPLLALPNALCISHLGYVTRETILHHYRDAIDQIAAYCAGQPINVVNPEAVARGGLDMDMDIFQRGRVEISVSSPPVTNAPCRSFITSAASSR